VNIPYDYAAKGAEDFLSGKKDERLYAGADKHNADYRRGWQQARREGEDRAFEHGSESITARPAPIPEPARCPHDTDGDGDCHLCHRTGNCPNRQPEPSHVVPFEPKPGAPKPPANEGWQGIKSSTWHFFRADETRSICKRADRMSVEASDKAGVLTCSICEARLALKSPKPSPSDPLSLF
jgi:hypothetical protein